MASLQFFKLRSESAVLTWLPVFKH